MTSLVVTVLGPDRPGLVKLISDCASSHEANWADCVLANFAGQFCGAIHLEVPEEKHQALVAALQALRAQGLTLQVLQVKEPAATKGRMMKLDLVGNDRPGIVKAISSQLALHGANIVKMSSSVSSAPMSGGTLFSVHALIMLDESQDSQDLRKALEDLADELMVDLELERSN